MGQAEFVHNSCIGAREFCEGQRMALLSCQRLPADQYGTPQARIICETPPPPQPASAASTGMSFAKVLGAGLLGAMAGAGIRYAWTGKKKDIWVGAAWGGAMSLVFAQIDEGWGV